MERGYSTIVEDTVTHSTGECAVVKRKPPLKLRLNGAPDSKFIGEKRYPGHPPIRDTVAQVMERDARQDGRFVPV